MTLDDPMFKDVFLGSYSGLTSPSSPMTKMFVSFDGMHSGVPTLTTSTLTPTTLRNIEQTYFELAQDTSNVVPGQAGFVAPLPTFQLEPDIQEHSLCSTESNSSESWQVSPSRQDLLNEDNSSESTSIQQSSTSKRNMGGRKPKSISYLSPEEEEKRRVRRERNKLAAARCRKRRVDQTNTLTDLVDQLEAEKNQLKLEIQELELAKKDLEYLLQTHRTQCKITVNAVIDVSGADKNMPKSKLEFKAPAIHTPLLERIKQEIDDSSYDDREPGVPPLKRALISAANPVFGAASNPAIATLTSAKPNRPSSLPFGAHKNVADMAGIQIQTPSTGVNIFNFDSLMDGGTGLTPVAMQPSHNRNPLDLATPNTPGEPAKLVSL